MNNVFDQDPPFVTGNFENGYDQWHSQYQGANLVCGIDEAVLKLLRISRLSGSAVCGRRFGEWLR